MFNGSKSNVYNSATLDGIDADVGGHLLERMDYTLLSGLNLYSGVQNRGNNCIFRMLKIHELQVI